MEDLYPIPIDTPEEIKVQENLTPEEKENNTKIVAIIVTVFLFIGIIIFFTHAFTKDTSTAKVPDNQLKGFGNTDKKGEVASAEIDNVSETPPTSSTPTPEFSPTPTVTPTPTPEPTQEPSATPTAEPTPEPTSEPTTEPTYTPTPSPEIIPDAES